MQRIWAIVLGMGFGGNAAFMLARPLAWYAFVPGVDETGPANVHFIRDIGCAYLVVALSLFWLAMSRLRAWPAALASGTFLSLHGLVHVGDALTGRGDLHHLAAAVPAIFLPAVFVMWLALSSSGKGAARLRGEQEGRAGAAVQDPTEVKNRSASPRRRGLAGRLVEGSLVAFERDFRYDLTYAREIVDASAIAFLKFGLFFAFASHREGVPTDALFAAKVVAARHEDCGPCTQLVVTMAEREGVASSTLCALLARDAGAMSPDASLGFRFASAVLARDIALADALRAEVRERWGRRAVVSMAFAIASSRVYPAVKYALGYARTCSRVVVAGKDADLARLPEAALP